MANHMKNIQNAGTCKGQEGVQAGFSAWKKFFTPEAINNVQFSTPRADIQSLILISGLYLKRSYRDQRKIIKARAHLEHEQQELLTANSKLQRYIKQQHQLQGELIEAQRLSSLGLMVSGVAHEMNTPLGGAAISLSNAQLINQQLKDKIDEGFTKQFLESSVEKIDDNLQRMLTNDLDTASNRVRKDIDDNANGEVLDITHEDVVEKPKAIEPKPESTPKEEPKKESAAPKAEKEGEMGDSQMGLQARLMSKALRKLTGSINKTGCVCIFINQLREKIGAFFGSPVTTPGGKAIKFHASMRIDIRRIGMVKNKEEEVGNKSKLKVVKNKLGRPKIECEFELIFGEGISKERDILELAEKYKVISKSGAWYKKDEENFAQGKIKAEQYLKDNPEICREWEEEVRALVKERLDKLKEG